MKNRKVYVVQNIFEPVIVGVFSSMELANECIGKMKKVDQREVEIEDYMLNNLNYEGKIK